MTIGDALSYHDLPPYLKPCFTYCSVFPKDYQFQKERLVLLWMAEGFLQQPKSKKRMEEVGDQYLTFMNYYQGHFSKNQVAKTHVL